MVIVIPEEVLDPLIVQTIGRILGWLSDLKCYVIAVRLSVPHVTFVFWCMPSLFLRELHGTIILLVVYTTAYAKRRCFIIFLSFYMYMRIDMTNRNVLSFSLI